MTDLTLIDDDLMKAPEVAKKLNIAVSSLYGMTVLRGGDVPCFKIGGAVRFNRRDIEEYLQSCRFISTKQKSGGVSVLTASSPDKDTGLQSYFRKAGVEPKRKNTTKKRPPASSHLRMVQKNAGQ